MKINVGKLKEIIKDLPDDVILADLDCGNDEFTAHDSIKRILLLEGPNNQKYLTINRMGSHFTEDHKRIHRLVFIEKYWDK